MHLETKIFMTHLIEILTLLWWFRNKPPVSLRYACTLRSMLSPVQEINTTLWVQDKCLGFF